MAQNCSRCGAQLSFRNSFVWEKKPVCRTCLRALEQGQKSDIVSKPIEDASTKEGMSGGEWLGAFFCTPYGLIKYFEWKKTYPRKSSQVCTLYLILLALNILFALVRIATESSY